MSMHGVIFAGFGGQGVMLMGQLLSYAGMMEGKYVTWMPSYGPEMRGGTANCTVVLDDEPVGSPVIDKPSVVVAMNIPSLIKFEKDIEKNGILILNTSVIDREPTRKDLKVYKIDANKISEELGNTKVANVVVLGAFLKATGAIKKESLEKAIEKKLTGKKEKLIEINISALQKGYDEVVF